MKVKLESFLQEICVKTTENDQYPVIIPDEKGIEKDSTKVKSLIFNTWMNRYR